MADKTITVPDPALKDLICWISFSDSGVPVCEVRYSAHENTHPGVLIHPTDLSAADRAAGAQFLAAIRIAARLKWGGF